MRRRPWLASLGLTAALLLTGSAAYGDPTTGSTSDAADSTGSAAPPAAPDSGVRPQGGTVSPPTGTGTTGNGTGNYLGNTPVGPMGTQILLQTQIVQTYAEQAKQAQQSIGTDQTLISSRQATVKQAQEEVDTLQSKVDSQASKAYKDQAKVPDKFDPYASQFNQLNDLEPWLDKGDGYNQGQQDGKDYLEALKLLNTAQAQLKSAQDQLASDQALYKKLTGQYQQASTALATMRTQNSTAVAQLNAAEAAYNAQYAGQIGTSVNGWTANAKAQQAVRFAVSQVGKPYEWGAEGPNAYDCSGLVLASYLSAGVSLPRVADDQYMATSGQSVPISGLLPGDLLFYGTNPGVPTSIYHVAMYVGNGNMVQAPDYGIPVQVVPVAFGQLYGATRVVPATRTAPSKPKPPTSPPPKSPSPPPTQPSTPPVTTHPTTPPPPPTTSAPPPPGTGSDSPTPSASPSASASASASDSASASTSSSASTSASTSSN